jgi:hypothetical protein
LNLFKEVTCLIRPLNLDTDGGFNGGLADAGGIGGGGDGGLGLGFIGESKYYCQIF